MPNNFLDKIESLLLEQGEQCTEQGTCLYRSVNPEGKHLKCAIGFILTDEQISDHELMVWNSTADMFSDSLIEEIIKKENINLTISNARSLLKAIQEIHDNTSNATFAEDIKKGFSFLREDLHLYQNESLLKGI